MFEFVRVGAKHGAKCGFVFRRRVGRRIGGRGKVHQRARAHRGRCARQFGQGFARVHLIASLESLGGERCAVRQSVECVLRSAAVGCTLSTKLGDGQAQCAESLKAWAKFRVGEAGGRGGQTRVLVEHREEKCRGLRQCGRLVFQALVRFGIDLMAISGQRLFEFTCLAQDRFVLSFHAADEVSGFAGAPVRHPYADRQPHEYNQKGKPKNDANGCFWGPLEECRAKRPCERVDSQTQAFRGLCETAIRGDAVRWQTGTP